jgi:cytochrome c oxidase subunit II
VLRQIDAKQRRAAILLIGLALIVSGAYAATRGRANEQVVKVIAKRFSYTTAEIVLKKGRPAVLEISSLDFVHGFKVPDLDIRVDLPPGKSTQVRFTPRKTGTFVFLCDNFCGSGHEQMNGKIVVKD